jgi:hypothetical protein
MVVGCRMKVNTQTKGKNDVNLMLYLCSDTTRYDLGSQSSERFG